MVKILSEMYWKKASELHYTHVKLLIKFLVTFPFLAWQEEKLDELLKITEESKRDYGCLNELKKKHKILKERFKDLV